MAKKKSKISVPGQPAPKAGRPQGLRMNELMEATGLTKSTLLYYVGQGLLPEPVKTSPNMAYYSPQCVERAALIKTLQSQHRLPLGKIKMILQASEQGQDIAPLLALAQEVFGQEHDDKLDTDQFLAAAGMEPGHLQQLLDTQLLLPLEPGRYDQQDLAMARVYVLGHAQGIKPEDVVFYPSLGKKIVDQEMRLRSRLTRELPPEMDAAVTMGLVKAARATRSYVIDRLFQHRIAASGDLKDEKMLGREGDHESGS
jgi:DNA-binding transcriptional MerR regulator